MSRAAALALAALVAALACAPAARPAPGAAAWASYGCDSAIGSPAGASGEPGFSTGSWDTDFSKHCVPLSEIVSGGVPRDGIPPIDDPRHEAAAPWLDPKDPLIVVAHGGEARGYPLRILIWHEIVNDRIGDLPLAVTYCPLCDAALVFDRRVGGRELTFGTTGLLRRSDLVMWDRQTRSFWQQATGEGIVGEHTAQKLRRVDSLVISFAEYRAAYPGGLVLSGKAADEEARAKTGRGRDYSVNPYVGYGRPDSGPISGFWNGPKIDDRLPPKARVAVAAFADTPVAYSLEGARAAVARNDRVGGRDIVVLFMPGLASPLDRAAISTGADVGQAALFDRRLDGRTLTFAARAGGFTDAETGSTWTVAGLATGGPLAGRRLSPVPHEVTFWFIWSVFRPSTEVRALAG